MQGVYISNRRPKSKKEIREMATSDPDSVSVEATSLFGNEYGGPITRMDIGSTITFVGPDPFTKRMFFGSIKRTGERTFQVK